MFQCKDLLALASLSHVQLAAGEMGLNREIRWAYKLEDTNLSEFVHGQELLAISISEIQKMDCRLYELIQQAIQQEVSAVLVLEETGDIDQIDKLALKEANSHELPLFVMRENVSLLNVFEEIGHAIAYQSRIDIEKQDLLAEIVFGGNKSEERVTLQAARLEYDIAVPQRIFAIHLKNEDNEENETKVNDSEKKIFMNLVNKAFKLHQKETVLSYFDDNIVGLTKADENDHIIIMQIMESLGIMVEAELPQIHYQVGVGDVHEQISELQQGFQEASKAIALTRNQVTHQKISWFDELGFYQVLLSIDENPILNSYEEKVLGNLIEYDEKNHTELVKTLETYFLCDENIKNTAEKIYSHPNTIKYRLNKIEKISGIDLKSSRNRLALYNALLIYRMNRC